MDLLTGYGSDGSDGEEEHVQISDHPRVRQQIITQTAAQQRQHQQPAPSLSKASSGVDKLVAVEGASSGTLWTQLPRPTSHAVPSTSGLSGLPPPAHGGARKVVAMQLPFRKELLAAALDSDDEEEPAAKRVKATGAKSRLMDFLPPPKYDTGIARTLGAGARELPAAGAAKAPGSAAASTSTAAGTGSAAARTAGAAGGSDSLPSDSFSGGAAVPYGNEAYRVRDHDGSAHGYPAAAAAAPYPYGAHDQSTYYAHNYGPAVGPSTAAAGPSAAAAGPAGGRGLAAAAAAAAGPEDLIAEALRAEQERATKRGGGGGGVKLVEIKAKDLTHMDPAAREAAASARDALGPEYSLSLRRSAVPFEGSKMARRKHQIGTLLFNARMQELETIEKRTQGQKTKAETAAKYGW